MRMEQGDKGFISARAQACHQLVAFPSACRR
jgi:hypothetical protein